MGVSIEQYRARVGCFNGKSIYNYFYKVQGLRQDNLSHLDLIFNPAISLLVYGYIIMISIIFSMHMDILISNYKMKHFIKPNETIIFNAIGSVPNIRAKSHYEICHCETVSPWQGNKISQNHTAPQFSSTKSHSEIFHSDSNVTVRKR